MILLYWPDAGESLLKPKKHELNISNEKKKVKMLVVRPIEVV